MFSHVLRGLEHFELRQIPVNKEHQLYFAHARPMLSNTERL